MAPEHKDLADATLLGACEKLTTQLWYNQKVTTVSHYWADRGVRVYKEDIVGKKAKPKFMLNMAQYVSVSKMSMRFYIAAKLPLHHLELNIAFSDGPRLG